MDYLNLLEEQRKFYREKSITFSKDEIRYISGKDSFKGKLTGFLTKEYYQREKVIKFGDIFYGYVFQEFITNNDDSNVLTWILFSPEQKMMENPLVFKKITENIRDFLKKEKTNRKEKQLELMLSEPLSSAPFEELPFEISEGRLVYFVKMIRKRNFAYSFQLGLNLFIANLAISKQILYLPERYMTETFKKAYDNHELIF